MTEKHQQETNSAPRQKTSAKHWTEAAGKVRKLVADMYINAFTQGKPVVWAMLSGINEIFVAMDVVPIYPENYAALCAVKRSNETFIEKAEAEGFSNVVCSYARTGLGYSAICQETGEIPPYAPDGGMMKPVMLIGSSLACDTRFKWFQSFTRYVDAPYFSFDGPSPPEDTVDRKDVREQYIKYNVAQLQGLINFMEETLGRKMDWDRLEEAVRYAEKTHYWWYEAFSLCKAVPCPMPVEDALNVIVPGFFRIGEPEALQFYKDLYDELQMRIEKKISVVPEEKYRLLWGGGLPPWHTMKVFNFVEERGAVFVFQISYPLGRPVEIPDHITNPLERKAYTMYERALMRKETNKRLGISGRFNFAGLTNALPYIEPYKIDGVVMHWLRSCRGTTIGQIYQKSFIEEHSPVPCIFLESDICDVRDYFEADWDMKINAFLETLEARKRASG